MKKIIVLLVLLIALLAAPFVIGIITEQRIEALAAQYRLNSNVDHIEVDIQRGWFHSEIISTVTMHVAELSNEAFVLSFHHKIRHGPILWGEQRPLGIGFADVQSELQLPLKARASFEVFLKKVPPITLQTQLNYNGTQDSQFSLPAFHFDDEQTQTIIYPLTLTIHGNLAFDRIQGELNWQGLEFTAAGRKFTVGQSIAQIHMQKASVIWAGSINWTSDYIQLSAPETRLEIKDLSIAAKNAIDQEKRVSSTQTLSLERMTYNGVDYGPGKYSIVLNHIPLTVYEKLEEVQNKMAMLPAKQRAQAMQAMGFSLFSVLPDILAAEPEIELRDVLFTTPDGDVQASLYLTLAGLNEQDMMNFTKIKRHIRADMELSFPTALLSNSDHSKIKAFIQKGWLIEKNAMLYSKLHMADGVLSINDQSIALPF